jgi:hypothetical protein
LPWYVDAYIALVPDSAMSRETGGSWFTLNAVQIRGNSWTLRRDSYECVGNSLSSIEGDGVHELLRGTIEKHGSAFCARATSIECDTCIGTPKVDSDRCIPISFDSKMAKLDGVRYAKSTPDEMSCPAGV